MPYHPYKPQSYPSPGQRRPEGGVGAAETGDPLSCGVTQVYAAWAEIPMYHPETWRI